ncbi:MAG TPA: aminotransferase class I/II-fold pyridoxal phosphate-dependent enzyme [Actinomycetota bacterium]|nr:aminotransferase class I/II-fold pyridoxal phosphate-dependent enzyme [Actinomycetota bacterium]
MSGYPLDPSPEQMREMGEAALEYVIGFLHGLEDAPAQNVEGALEAALRLRASPPEQGVPFAEAFDDFRGAAERALETAGPGYLPYIPGGGLFASALAQFVTMAVNRFPNLWEVAPGLAQIEQNVIRWLCDLFDYPEQARGLLTTGGSLANLSAIVTARHARLGEDFADGAYYLSEQTHASVSKAAAIAGLPRRAMRLVPVDAELRMDADALKAMVAEDRAAGLRPFLVVPAAGTTNTGAVDPLDAVADVAEAEGLWMHVDAAYGGFFQLTERGRERFRGIERADSITLDPHKGLFLPYGTGSLIVRDGAALRDAHFVGAAYLQDRAAEAELPNWTEYSPELSRDHRGFRVWLPLQLHGVATFRDALDEKLDLTQRLFEGLSAIPELEIPWAPQLTVVAFRLAGATDEADKAFLQRINDSKRVVLSSTTIEERHVIRACIVSHRTHRERIDEAIAIVRAAAREASSSRPTG